MAEDLQLELARIGRLSAARLVERYEELFGQAPRSKHRAFLARRVAWKLQEREWGGLSQLASERLALLAESLDPLGELAARRGNRDRSGERGEHCIKASASQSREIRLPKPGAAIRRIYKGREIVVRVLDESFEYNGKRYRSLSAIAKVVTGAHWNGLLFFGLTRQNKRTT